MGKGGGCGASTPAHPEGSAPAPAPAAASKAPATPTKPAKMGKGNGALPGGDVLRAHLAAHDSKTKIIWCAPPRTRAESPALTRAAPNPPAHCALPCSTMGPKNANEATLEALLDAGMDIMRLNFSHGSYEWFESVINMLRDILKRKPGRACAIALDTKGPEIRTGLLAGDDDVVIEAGSEVVLSCDEADFDQGTAAKLFVDYPELPKVLKPGMSVFVKDGLLNLEVTACGADSVTCKAVNTAAIGGKKGINLPGAIVTLPAVSEKDKADLEFGAKIGVDFGAKIGVDFVFASFIRKGLPGAVVEPAVGNGPIFERTGRRLGKDPRPQIASPPQASGKQAQQKPNLRGDERLAAATRAWPSLRRTPGPEAEEEEEGPPRHPATPPPPSLAGREAAPPPPPRPRAAGGGGSARSTAPTSAKGTRGRPPPPRRRRAWRGSFPPARRGGVQPGVPARDGAGGGCVAGRRHFRAGRLRRGLGGGACRARRPPPPALQRL